MELPGGRKAVGQVKEKNAPQAQAPAAPAKASAPARKTTAATAGKVGFIFVLKKSENFIQLQLVVK